MAGYVVGTQAWYDQVRRRIVDIGEKLKSPELDQETRNSLYDEQVTLVLALDGYDDKNLVNNPIV